MMTRLPAGHCSQPQGRHVLLVLLAAFLALGALLLPGVGGPSPWSLTCPPSPAPSASPGRVLRASPSTATVPPRRPRPSLWEHQAT